MKDKLFREIFHQGIHIATHVKPEESEPGLSFVTTDDKFLQLGIWNYEKGHNLPTHFHNEFERSSFKTNEFVFVILILVNSTFVKHRFYYLFFLHF